MPLALTKPQGSTTNGKNQIHVASLCSQGHGELGFMWGDPPVPLGLALLLHGTSQAPAKPSTGSSQNIPVVDKTELLLLLMARNVQE